MSRHLPRLPLLGLCCAGMLTLTLTLAAPLVRAESLSTIFRDANAAYFQGDFKAAARRYQSLVDAGVEDADVYFNLGTAQARQGALGLAVLYFERAERLAPGDSEAAHALATARAALGKRRAEAQGEATVETRPPLSEALVQSYGQDLLAALVLGLDVLFFGLLVLFRRLRSDTLRTACAIAAAASALALGATGFGLAVKRGVLDQGRAAVVLRENAELREGPDPRAVSRGTAHEGQNARVLRRDGSFLRVRVAGGGEGWLQDSDVAVIAPD